MSDSLRVLVTGATGKLGSESCRALSEHGFRVRATDQKVPSEFSFDLELGDLTDEFFVHRLLADVEAVVHLGNHPNAFAGPSPQRLLAENTTMNANVLLGSAQRGVKRIVFASSVQAFLYTNFEHNEAPWKMPYLPLDGRAPCAPGPNTYGQSKEFAEIMLRHLAAAHPTLSVTALRFPWLLTERVFRRLEQPRSLADGWFNFPECLSHLTLKDAGDLVAHIVGRDAPGYHQYFPAQAMQFRGRSTADMIREFYPDTPLTQPIDDIRELIDVSELARDTGWAPTERVVVELKG